MGKGDKRTRRGKLFKGSFGNARPHKLKKKKAVAAPAAAAATVAEVAEAAKASRKKAVPERKKKEKAGEQG